MAFLAGVVVVGGLAACGDDGDEQSSTTTEAGSEPTTTTTTAGPDADGQPIETGEVGGPSIVVDDVALSVVSVGEPYDYSDDRVIDIVVRAENLGPDQLASPPSFVVQCSDEYYLSQWGEEDGATYVEGTPLPPGATLEGKIISSYPADCELPTIVAEGGSRTCRPLAALGLQEADASRRRDLWRWPETGCGADDRGAYSGGVSCLLFGRRGGRRSWLVS